MGGAFLKRGITIEPNIQVVKEEPIQNTKNWNKTVEDIKKMCLKMWYLFILQEAFDLDDPFSSKLFDVWKGQKGIYLSS